MHRQSSALGAGLTVPGVQTWWGPAETSQLPPPPHGSLPLPGGAHLPISVPTGKGRRLHSQGGAASPVIAFLSCWARMGALCPTPTPGIGWATTGLGEQTVPHPHPRSPTHPSPSLLLQKPTPAQLPPEAPRVPVFSSLPGPRFLQVGHRTSIERKPLAPPPLWVLPTHTKICLLKAQLCQYLVLQSLLTPHGL